jgi:hypothetical protein
MVIELVPGVTWYDNLAWAWPLVGSDGSLS